jgi:hypothetical protein
MPVPVYATAERIKKGRGQDQGQGGRPAASDGRTGKRQRRIHMGGGRLFRVLFGGYFIAGIGRLLSLVVNLNEIIASLTFLF